MNLCPKCRLNMDIHGRVHNCNPPKILGKTATQIIVDDPVGDQVVEALTVGAHRRGKESIAAVHSALKAQAIPCPVCETRRRVKALQMKRYREKKNG